MTKSGHAIPIQQLRIGNFGCVRNATVELEPLTVLVGPNDSGKSMLLKALSTWGTASLSTEGWGAAFPTPAALNARSFDGKGGPIRIGARGLSGDLEYSYDVEVGVGRFGVQVQSEHLRLGSASAERTERELTFRASADTPHDGPHDWMDASVPLLNKRWLAPPGGAIDEWQRFSRMLLDAEPLLAAMSATAIYSLRPEALRRGVPHAIAPLPEEQYARLGIHGDGLANAIADLLLRGRDILERIEDGLTRAMPQVKRIDIKQRLADRRATPVNEIELVIRSGTRIPSRSVSDGVLLYLGYLYLVLGPNPAPLLLVEEPETGLHPGMLRKLVGLFHDMTTGAHGGAATQVILTTHSPMLLNLIEPQGIRVVQRGDDGATTVTPFMKPPGIEALLDYQGPGEIWVNEGEEYIVGSDARP
ncbi:AAA family ATPase [Sorangium sp. So ce1024]|uniref:AAA family ATPase n=1 Tax=unclassified Sorangium TaxID=2621164 RepID=UPI003EFE4E4E